MQAIFEPMDRSAALPATDPRRPVLTQLAHQHRDTRYCDPMVAHWTPSFAGYLLTGRRLPATA